MCGIIGIIAEKGNIFPEIYNGLVSLQHRGQDSAGIMVSDGKKADIKKGLGLLFDVFGVKPSTMRGRMGIGHLRYPTAGSNINCDAQPVVIRNRHEIGMAHNGNLENSMQLRTEIRKAGSRLETTSDTELMLHIISAELEGREISSDSVFMAAQKVMERAKGSYSVACMISGEGVMAIRDPKGFMPLAFGRKGKSYCFASETVALQALGYEVISGVEPGNVIFIDKNLNVHTKTIRKESNAHCMFQWVYFARPDSSIEGRSVYGARLDLGRQLAKKWLEGNRNKRIDVVIPVPDTSRPAAMAVAEELGVPYREGLIKNRYIGRTFIMPSQEARDSSIRLKLSPIIEQIRGKRVAIVDDSIVRGTTSRRIVDIVRGAGAQEVHFFVTCPPIKWPCFYGIDMSTRKELIASEKPVEEIRRQIGADTLIYQDMEGLRKAIGLPDLCTACLDGSYPTGISKENVERLERERGTERETLIG